MPVPAPARWLDDGPLNPHHRGVSRPDGRSRYGRKAAGEESPGSIDMRCRITSGGGNPRESATENEPPRFGEARVKRCGKSAPRFRQRRRHGKPHREQNRIGTASRAVRASDNAAGLCQARRPGRLLEAMCEHGPRGMAVTCRPRKRAVPYRTRLTGWLIRSNEGLGATRRAPRHFNAGSKYKTRAAARVLHEVPMRAISISRRPVWRQTCSSARPEQCGRAP